MKNIKFILSIIITFLILYFIFNKIDFREVWSVFLGSNKYLLLASFLFVFLIHPFAVFRWKLILKILGYNVDFKGLLNIYLANLPISKITPASSGDFLRSVHLRGVVPLSKGMGLVFFEIVIDILFLALSAVIGGLILGNYIAVLIGFCVIFGFMIFMFIINKIIIYFPEKYKIKINNFLNVFYLVYKNPKDFFAVLGISLLTLIILLTYFKFSFFIFGEKINFLVIFTFYPLVNFFSLIPVSVYGIGIRESSMLYFFSQFVSGKSILAVSLVYSFLGAILIPLICFPFTYKLVLKYVNNIKKYE